MPFACTNSLRETLTSKQTTSNMTSKVFVGNLAFKTTDQQLVEAFQEFGKVKTGVVITRGRRSLGYGFVEFESHDAAEQAVKIKNGNTFNERPVKVELATDNPVRAERPPQAGTNPSSSSPGNKNVSNPEGGAAPRRRRMRRPNNSRVAPNTKRNQNERNSENRENRRSGGEKNNNNNNSDSQPRQQRRRRRRTTNKSQNNEERVLSATGVFVANLPFGVIDEELKDYFKEYNPKAAHVVVTRNGRSRGYGFVEFNNENEQKAAIDGKNGQEFSKEDAKRPITVTPSYKTQELTVATEM